MCVFTKRIFVRALFDIVPAHQEFVVFVFVEFDQPFGLIYAKVFLLRWLRARWRNSQFDD